MTSAMTWLWPPARRRAERVRLIAQALGGIQHALAGLVGKLDVGAVIQDEGHRRARHARFTGDVGTGRSSSHDGTISSNLDTRSSPVVD